MAKTDPKKLDTRKVQRRRGYYDIQHARQVRVGIGESTLNVNESKTKLGDINDTNIAESRINDSVFTGSIFRTSEGPNRIEIARTNELGSDQDGVYLYVNGIIRTALISGSVFFYDLNGVLTAAIQQPTPGVISVAGSTVSLIASNGFVTLDGLPINDPGGSNRLWNDNGTVKIT